MAEQRTLTFAEHIQELRKRLMWSLLFVAIGAGIGYALHNSLLEILQQPLHEKLYYTTPTGAFSFIMKICAVFGLIVALPAVLYHSFAFFEPLIKSRTRKAIAGYVFVSVLMAGLGITFAYFVSLPAALNFLVNFGSEGGIESLITANEYFNFVLAYIAGFALLFQLPLIITFINRITPLTPSKLIGGTRYVVLGSFLISAIITPTPDPFNQALMAVPVILLYFLSALLVIVTNSRRNRKARKQAPIPAFSAPIPQPVPAAPIPATTTLAAQFQQPVQQPSAPVQQRPRPVQPQRARLVNDMVVPRSRLMQSQQALAPVQRRPIAQPIVRRAPTRLITDFIPATE